MPGNDLSHVWCADTRDPCYFLSQKERRSPLGIENGGRVLNFMDTNQLYICSPEDCLQEIVNMKL